MQCYDLVTMSDADYYQLNPYAAETTEGPEEPEEPECEAACASDLERVTRQVESNTDDVTYLTEDVPTVLANTFTTVNNLEQLVLSLQAEVERLTRMVSDHHDKFMCLAGSMEEEE